jgi:hypothetical protein
MSTPFDRFGSRASKSGVTSLTLTAERAARLRAESLRRAEERDAERDLGLRLIAIGYKVLRDRGASDTLKRVRDRLKKSA